MNQKTVSVGNLLQDQLVWRNIDVYWCSSCHCSYSCTSCTGVAPQRLQFKLRKNREALEGNVQQFTVNTKKGKASHADAPPLNDVNRHTVKFHRSV